MLAIIGAMEEEVSILKEKMKDLTIETRAGLDFHIGKLGQKDVIVVRCGIGKVNAAVCTQILADIYHADAIVNTGIAGSLKNEIDICDVVLSTDVLHHDMDAVYFGYEPGQVPRMDVLSFPADETLLAIARNACKTVNDDVKVWEGRIVSGDQFISSKEKKDWIGQTFDGFCTEMEGAAIAQTAYLNKIPFLVIRAISDKADESAQMDYKEFETRAIANSVALMEAVAAAW